MSKSDHCNVTLIVTRVIFEGDCKILVGYAARQHNAIRHPQLDLWHKSLEKKISSYGIYLDSKTGEPTCRQTGQDTQNDPEFISYFYVPICISNLLHFYDYVCSSY